MIFGGSTYGSAAYGGQEFGAAATQTTTAVSATAASQFEFKLSLVKLGTHPYNTLAFATATSTSGVDFLAHILNSANSSSTSTQGITETVQGWQEFTQELYASGSAHASSLASLSNVRTAPWQILGSVSAQSAAELEFTRNVVELYTHQTQNAGFVRGVGPSFAQSSSAVTQSYQHILELLGSVATSSASAFEVLYALVASDAIEVDQGAFKVVLAMLLNTVSIYPTYFAGSILTQPSILLGTISTG